MYTKRNLTCEQCTDYQQRHGKEPDCIGCGKESLLPENEVINCLMNEYGSTFVDGMGSINMLSIRQALLLEDIKDKTFITKKLIVYLRTALDTRSKKKTPKQRIYLKKPTKEHTDGRKNNKTES